MPDEKPEQMSEQQPESLAAEMASLLGKSGDQKPLPLAINSKSEPGLEKIPERVISRLKEQGIDPHAVANAVRIAMAYEEEEFREHLMYLRERQAEDSLRLREKQAEQVLQIEDQIWERKEKNNRASTYSIWTMATVGTAAIVGALVSSYEQFSTALKHLLKLGFFEWLVPTAFAQNGQVTANGIPAVLPVFIYVVYVLLSTAYVVTLFGVFFGRDAKSRANAMEVFKGLNAFFIGAISGKLI